MKQKGQVWAAAFVVVLCMAFAVLTSAESPSWWVTVVDTNLAPNDFAPVLAGQLKWMATNAAAELDTLPGGAGTGVHALVSGFTPSNNYVPINLGQLKNTAVPFYQRLMAVGYATNSPWTEATADDSDFAPALLGQLKYVFAFDVSADSDDDDLPDWWEVHWFGSTTNWTGLDHSDSDDLNNAAEYAAGTNPTAEDTDGDELDDYDEVVVYGTDPTLPDTDSDGLSDGEEAHTCRRFSYNVASAPYSWLNLATNSTSLRSTLPDEDDGGLSVSLPFSFPFFGVNYDEVEVGVNGLIEFGDAMDGLSPWWNEALPEPLPFPLIAAFWYDLCVFPENADLQYASLSIGTSTIFVLEWRDVAIQYDPDNTHLTFQAIVESSGVIRVNYQVLTGTDTDGSLATFGVQSAEGAACQYAFAEPGCVTAGLSLCYTPQQDYTDPLDPDTDNDDMPDGWEVAHGLAPVDSSDATEDADDDGLTNLEEYQNQTEPHDADTDGDDMADGWEVTYDLDPRDPSDAAGDADSDGLSNLQEYQHGTNPGEADTDSDGVNDGNEALRDRTDPTNPDRTPPAVYLITPANGTRKVVVP